MAGRRKLSDDERSLWQRVTESIAPRSRVLPRDDAPEEKKAPPPPGKMLKAHKLTVKANAAPPLVAKTLPPAPSTPAKIEKRLKQKIARGHAAIDARLDLHGHTQAEAHDALLRFLHRSQARGARNVLVITGKGGRGAVDRETGVLKRQVPLWLAQPEFRALVIGIENAAIAHGGEGALYLRLRKTRD